MFCVWLLLTAFSPSVPLHSAHAVKSDYFIGGWIPDLPTVFLAQWSPIFENYLNDIVGNSNTPPIKFHLVPVDFSKHNRAIDLITTGQLDFVCELDQNFVFTWFHDLMSRSFPDNHPIQLACLDAEAGFSPIATQRHLILGQEAGGYGALIFSSISNKAVTTLADIKGKRLGVTFVLAAGGFALGWKVSTLFKFLQGVRLLSDAILQLLSESGIDMFSDTEQVSVCEQTTLTKSE
jgi:hypothetical protein